ncbi:hypothetical protein [Wolbachia endosymbiont of Folsomia candida]|uniref:hypothetical protein n=1 Tax=Wolbachia endosymbiont of Folsomia candida TaxID=169402 RepID=UPI001300BC47|nr:hypothetical protein [Wolbachia endosymbiont of Folsomia candida]
MCQVSTTGCHLSLLLLSFQYLPFVIPVLRHWDPGIKILTNEQQIVEAYVKIMSITKRLDSSVTRWNDTKG